MPSPTDRSLEAQQRNPLDFITERNFSGFLDNNEDVQTMEDTCVHSPVYGRHWNVNRLGSVSDRCFLALMGYDTPEKCELNPLTFLSRVDVMDMAIYEVLELMHPCSDTASTSTDRVFKKGTVVH